MKRFYIFCIVLCGIAPVSAQTDSRSFDPAKHAVIASDRPDGRFAGTYAVAHAMLKKYNPECAFNPEFTHRQFVRWQRRVQTAMRDIMRHPELKPERQPVCIGSEQKDGYRQEKWEFYPLPGCVASFLVLIPDGATGPSPAVLCIPGSGMVKEHLTGDRPSANPHTAMALNIVRRGYVAVAVDNAASGEASDLEELTAVGYDYDTPARMLLEMGWSWLGYTSYLDRHVLEWMKQQPAIRPDRIVVNGFSLGTEPMMVLGVLDKSIYGFVYNDFLCNTLERAVVMTHPDEYGRRPFPNSIRHLIPRFWDYFNFPDIVASLAPRPVILTEGGLDRDFDIVRRAYMISGHPDNAELHHYPKYASPENRNALDRLPEGIDRTTYFELVNATPAATISRMNWCCRGSTASSDRSRIRVHRAAAGMIRRLKRRSVHRPIEPFQQRLHNKARTAPFFRKIRATMLCGTDFVPYRH